MRIGFHIARRPSQEVGFRPARERCRPEPAQRRSGRPSTAVPGSTVVAVDLDLGSNNTLFIRGQGGGLRWDRGQPLTCLAPKTWVWSAAAAEGSVEFQLLLNDLVWARGEATVLEPGSRIEITPDFEWPEIPKVA